MNSLTAGSALMIICGLPPSLYCWSATSVCLRPRYPYLIYTDIQTHIHPPAGPLPGATRINYQVPVSPDFRAPGTSFRTEESTLSGRGQPQADAWRTRRIGGRGRGYSGE